MPPSAGHDLTIVTALASPSAAPVVIAPLDHGLERDSHLLLAPLRQPALKH